MSKFVARIEDFTESNRAYYNEQMRQGIQYSVENFPSWVPAEALAWSQRDDIDYIALPDSVRNSCCVPACMAVGFLAYDAFLRAMEKDGITKNADGFYPYTKNGWEIVLTTEEIITTIEELLFDSSNRNEWDIHSFIGGVNLFISKSDEDALEYIINAVLEFASNKWDRIMAEKLREPKQVIQAPAKKGWLARLFG